MVESLALYVVKLVAMVIAIIIALIMNEREEKKNDVLKRHRKTSSDSCTEQEA